MIELVDIGQPERVQRRRRLPRAATSFSGIIPPGVQRRRRSGGPGTYLDQPPGVQSRRLLPGAGTYLGSPPSSVQERSLLPGAGTFVSGVDDDQIMLLESFQSGLGVTLPRREMPDQPQKIKGPTRFTNGDQYKIGPFLIPKSRIDNENSFTLTLPAKTARNSPVYREWLDWAVDAIWTVSRKWMGKKGICKPQGVDADEPGVSFWKDGPGPPNTQFQVDGKSRWAVPKAYCGLFGTFRNPKGADQVLYPRYDQGVDKNGDPVDGVIVGNRWVSHGGPAGTVRGVGPTLVPDDQVWLVDCFQGRKPVGKFADPNSNKKWAVFVTITGSTFVFQFEKVDDRSWWDKLTDWLGDAWNWLKELVVEVIEFVKDVFDWLKELVACMLAKKHLEALSNWYGGKSHLVSDSERDKLIELGVFDSVAEANAAQAGVTSQVAQAAADRLITKLCGPPPDKPSDKPSTDEKKGIRIAPLLLVGGAATALVLLT